MPGLHLAAGVAGPTLAGGRSPPGNGAPGSPEALRLRRVAAWVGRVNLLLALVIVLFAVMLVRGWP